MNHIAIFALVNAAREILRAGGHIDSGEFVIPAEADSNDEVPAVAGLRAALAQFYASSAVFDMRGASVNLFARIYTGDLVEVTAIGSAEPPDAVNARMAASDDGVLAIVGNTALLAKQTDGGVPMSKVAGKHPLTGRLPTPYRVQWEIDAFNATTPREAAMEAFERMQVADTLATTFTVLGNDGSSTTVDLSEPGDAEVAEWVGLHYARNFDAEPAAKKEEWRQRYREAHAA